MLALEFPPLSHITNWPEFFGNDTWGVNKVVLVYAFAVLFTMVLFTLGNKKQLVPTGAQNLAEMSVEFIEDGIVMETIGEKGLNYTPLLITFFFYVFFSNIFEIIPVIQMPGTARIAMPMVLALIAYVVYHGAGVKEHGPLGYLKHRLIPPGVPAALLILIIPIEFIIAFIVTPFTHTVRLFANLLAGHILLVTFALLTSSLITAETQQFLLKPMAILPFFMLVFLTAFEVLVAFLQAYIFTILTAVYIGGAAHPEH